MSTLQTVADTHQRRQKALAQRAATKLAEFWRGIDRGRIAISWQDVLPAAVTVLSTAQATAAAGSAIYIDDAVEAQGLPTPAEGRVASTAFAGVASDGRRLETLLMQPAIRTLTYLKQGATVDRAMAGGLLNLDMLARTQIADAGRAAESTAIAVRPKVSGYVRMLSQPSCSRCIILAGRWYRWNAGFRRHPRCDCRALPSQENVAGDLTTDPKRAFEAMTSAEQDRVFGKAGAEALRNGADLSQVVNARRGMFTAGDRTFTTESTTRRGVAPRVRLMPEEILREAKGNREVAIRLLRFHGYIR